MSQFVVSARKYRPQKFNEVVGQDHVASTLKNALVNNQLAHAFLFCGPRGVGKTTCARILAKVLNCENLQNHSDPCNECSSCKSFNDNASFNIIELDAASNNSVEHIRNLIEQVRFQPQHGTHKVFIIDEVHMLSSQAFNAFLKTLEEPPPYAVFILATTEKHKILPTILSRCQIFDFKRIQNAEIITQLKSIAEKENVAYDEEALNIIAQKSDGAMRDALSIFDKVVSSTDRNVKYQEVIDNLNILDFDYFFNLTNAFAQENVSEVMITFDEILKKGFDPELCLLGLAEHFRELLLAKNAATHHLITASQSLKERYINQSQTLSQSYLLSGLSILSQADIHFQKAKNKRLHAEIALSKLALVNRKIIGTSQQVTEPIQKKTIVDSSHVSKETITSNNSSAVEPKRVERSLPSTVQRKTSSPIIKKTIPKLSIGFSSEKDLLQVIEKEEDKKKQKPKALNLEIINQIWDTYIEEANSPSLKASLKIKDFELLVSKLIINLPSPSVLNTVVQEEGLLNRIRNAFDISGLEITPLLNNEKFPDHKKFTPKKKMSNREKYEVMYQANPLLKSIKNKFELKVDSD